MSWHPDLILNCHLRTNIPGEPGLDYPIHNIVQVGLTPVWIYSCGHSVTGDFIYLRWQRIWRILRWPWDGLPGLSYLSDGMRYGDLWTYFWGLNFNGDIKSMSNYFSEETNWGTILADLWITTTHDKNEAYIYCISTNSFHGNYSFLRLKYVDIFI